MWIFRTMQRRCEFSCTALICLTTIMTALAVEVYEVPIGYDLYQGENELDTGLLYDGLDDNEAYWKKDLLLLKLMKFLEQASVEDRRKNQSEYDSVDLSRPDAPGVKEAAVKRWLTSPTAGTQGTGSKDLAKDHLQRKWKIKKGKGIPALCYFKLCSFRSLS